MEVRGERIPINHLSSYSAAGPAEAPQWRRSKVGALLRLLWGTIGPPGGAKTPKHMRSLAFVQPEMGPLALIICPFAGANLSTCTTVRATDWIIALYLAPKWRRPAFKCAP